MKPSEETSPVLDSASTADRESVAGLVEELAVRVKRLQSILGPVLINAGEDPAIFCVVDQGKSHGPFTSSELTPWLTSPVDLLFDATRNELTLRRAPKDPVEQIPLGRHAGRIQLSSVLEVLRVFAENPGRRFTHRIIAYYTQPLWEGKTFIKYIERLRKLVGDVGNHPPFIVTDQSVDSSVSDSGCAYYANPDRRWRVIRYLAELSFKFPLPRPSARAHGGR